ncbi:MAG: hypothetical protein ACRCUI_09715, partial [Polymorphobacter sp.]
MIVASQLPRRYPASARVLLDMSRPDPVTGEMMAGGVMARYTRTQLELITDYRVVGEVVDKLGFTSNPAIIAQWQAETGGTGDMRRWAADRIVAGTSAGMLGVSNILEIQYTSPNPTISKNVVAILREAYIDATLRFRTESAARAAEWFREQAEKERRALVASEERKAEFEKANNIVVALGGMDPENAKLQALQSALLGARNSAEQTQFSNQMAVPSSGSVESLTSSLAAIDEQISQAAQQYGTAHPNYKALVSRRGLIQKELGRATSKAQSMSGSVGSYTAQSYAQLQADYEAQKLRVIAMRTQLSKLAELQRDVAMNQARYDRAVARAADLRLEAGVSETGLVILGDVVGSNTPTFPNVPLIGALSVIFGLGLGIVLALLSELIARRVRGIEDLAFAGKVPVLAVIADGRRRRAGGWIRRLFGRFGPQQPNANWQPAQ